MPQGNTTGHETNMSVAFESELLDAAPSLLHEPNDGGTEDPTETSDEQLPEPEPWEQSAVLASLPHPASLRQAINRSAITAPSLLPPPEPTPMPELTQFTKFSVVDSNPHDDSADIAKPNLQTTGEHLTVPEIATLVMSEPDATASSLLDSAQSAPPPVLPRPL